MTDDELVAIATEAAVAEAKRRGWLAPGAEALPEDPTTGASVLIAMLARPHLARLSRRAEHLGRERGR